MMKSVIVVLSVLMCAGVVQGEWETGFHLPGFAGSTTCAVEFDGGLVVGGSFVAAETVAAKNVAFFDGLDWSPLGEGLEGIVRDLIVHEGVVFAKGQRTSGSYIAEWSGTDWVISDMPEGGTSGLCSWNGDIYCGELCWDGSSWNRFIDPDATLSDLVVYEDRLVATGSFTHIGDVETWGVVAWDGTDVVSLLPEPFRTATEIEVFDGQLIAMRPQATEYVSKDGRDWLRPVWSYDGQDWSEFGNLFPISTEGEDEYLRHLRGIDGRLYLTEYSSGYSPLGTYNGSTIYTARDRSWDRTDWGAKSNNLVVLGSYEGRLVIGGYYDELILGGGSDPNYTADVRSLAFVSEDGLQPCFNPGLGVLGYISAMAVVDQDQYFVCNYSPGRILQRSPLARLSSGQWSVCVPLSGDEFCYARRSYPTSLCRHGSTLAMSWTCLCLGGWYEEIYTDRFSQVDGLYWEYGTPTPDLESLVEWNDVVYGVDDDVYAVDYQTERALFADVEGGSAWTLLVHGGDLVVGGNFTSIDGVEALGLALNDGAGWTSLGSSHVHIDELTSWREGIVAVDVLEQNNPYNRNIVKYLDSGVWTQLGEEITGIVSDVVSYRDHLYLGGKLYDLAGRDVVYLVRFRDGEWEAVGGDVDNSVLSLGVFDDGLWVCGDFDLAGDTPSSSIAVWSEAIVPNEVLRFTAERYDDGARLSWELAEPVYGTLGVQRLVAGGDPVAVSDRASSDDVLGSCLDTQAPAGAATYRLVMTGDDGRTVVLSETDLPSADLPAATGIAVVSPNPFNPETRVAFDLDRPGRAAIAVYDLLGRRVRVLLDRDLPAGRHEIGWNGRDDAGRAQASGTYVFRLETGTGNWMEKAQLVR